jgi:hypothetical protein
MDSNVDRSDKFYSGPRRFFFPRNSFIELTLSPSQVRKVRQWEKEGSEPVPMWYANSKRVLFVKEGKIKKCKNR